MSDRLIRTNSSSGLSKSKHSQKELRNLKKELDTARQELSERAAEIAQLTTALKNSEAEARRQGRFPERSPNPVLRVASDGTVLYRNPAAENLPCWHSEAGKSLPQEPLRRLLNQALSENRVIEEEIELGGLSFSVTVTPIMGENCANVYGRDITARKKAEAELERTARHRLLALQAACLGSWHYDPVTRVVTWDDRCKAILGLEQNSGPMDEMLARIHPEDRPGVQVKLAAALNPGNQDSHFSEHRIILPDGSVRWIEAYAIASAEGSGNQQRVTSFVGTATDITGRKHAQEALRESETRYRELVQNANSAIIRWKSDGSITFFNEFAQTFFGYDAAEIIGKHVGILLPDRDSHGQDLRELGQDIVACPERFVQNTNENICRDGRRVWMTWTNKPVLDENGQVKEILAVGTDISERKQVDEALRESEDKFRSAFANAAIGFAMTDPEGRFLDANAAYCSLTGYSIDELHALQFQNLIHPDDFAQNMVQIERMLSGQISDFTIENRYLRKDGFSVWIRKNVSLVCNAEGRPKCIIALIEDISERKRAEDDLFQSEARFRALAEALPQIVWTAVPQGGIEWFNRRWYEHTGEPQNSGVGWSWRRSVHSQDVRLTLAKWQEALQKEELFENEIRIRRHDGQYRWFLVRAWPMRDGSGNIIRWFGTNTDIHDLKEAESALRQGKEDFGRAQEVGQIGWWRLDTQRNVLTWSDENYRIFGIPVGTPLTYESFLQTIHPDDLENVDMRWNAGLRGEPYDIEHRIVAGGQIKWVRKKAYLEFDKTGRLLGGFGITQDITDRKEAEQQIRKLNETLEQRVAERTAEIQQQADQLRALASQLSQAELRERKRLAYILHDHIQQLIVAARMQIDWVRRDTNLERIRATAQGIEGILREALEASRSLTVDLSPPALHEAGLIGGLSWLAARFWEKYRFKVNLHTDSKAEPASETLCFLLFECARELLFNAMKHANVSEAQVRLLMTDDACLKLIVSDRGKGFDLDIIRNRQPGEMTFGLFSIQERLIYIGGGMEVESSPEKGSQITLWAPMDTAIAPSSWSGETMRKEEALGGWKRKPAGHKLCHILIVDDHKIMREGLTRLLQLESGLEVVGEAADGPQAIELARKLKPDVVIMDVNLGDMTGVEATRRILADDPAIKIIGLSMHEDSHFAVAMKEAGAMAYLTKGGPSEDLVAAIHACAQFRFSHWSDIRSPAE